MRTTLIYQVLHHTCLLLLISSHSFIRTHIDTVVIPISLGELVDKLTILLIKEERIINPQKLIHVRQELACLSDIYSSLCDNLAPTIEQQLTTTKEELKTVNEQLWEIEDAVRICEHQQLFDDNFITLARLVYLTNDKRIRIKNRISTLLGSRLLEQKSHMDFMESSINEKILITGS